MAAEIKLEFLKDNSVVYYDVAAFYKLRTMFKEVVDKAAPLYPEIKQRMNNAEEEAEKLRQTQWEKENAAYNAALEAFNNRNWMWKWFNKNKIPKKSDYVVTSTGYWGKDKFYKHPVLTEQEKWIWCHFVEINEKYIYIAKHEYNPSFFRFHDNYNYITKCLTFLSLVNNNDKN